MEVTTNRTKPKTPRSSSYKLGVLEKLTDPAEFIKFINSVNKSEDSEIEAKVDRIGYPAALWYQRQAMLEGNINLARACQIYIQGYKERAAARSKPKPHDPTSDSAALGSRPKD